MAKPPNRSQNPGEVTLSRDLSLFTITMIGVGGMIGAGIFVLTGIAAGVAGPALILAFFLNGLVTMLTAMVYAELGSAFPEAGGGYLWVKEAMGGAQGFLAGWMSWFAHAVAGSLYALAFGRFASELIIMAGLQPPGLTVHQMTLGLMTFIIVIFTYINYRGVSETGAIGNIITMTKVVILGFFVVFGILAMLRAEEWHTRFTTGFLPNGFGGVLTAMGLTFIAFEGYEIIAQAGEEVVNPKKNIPRAIFLSIIIVVIIYIFVGVVAIGATHPPEGLKAYEYLGLKKEVAIVEVAQQIFPFGMGAVVLLLSGLVSTMSALNATTYSSSRVSFAMGRDHNLPELFSWIHPARHTPYFAVLLSGALMLLMAWSLPIEDVAASADILFLLLFFQVNIAVMALRQKMPDLERGYIMPWFPVVPILGLISKAFLAIYLFGYSPIAWYFTIAWVVIGLLTYYAYFSKIEAMEKPKEILLEEVLVSRDYSVLVPVEDHKQARILGKIASVLACDNEGEVLALHVVQVPQQLNLPEGRLFLKDGRSYLEEVIKQAKMCDVPVHTIIRLSRNVTNAIRQTAIENASDLIVLGWPGYTSSPGRLFGSVADPIVDNPPADVVIVRYREWRPLKRVLVPVSGGLNSRRAVRLAASMARAERPEAAALTLLHVLPTGYTEADHVRGTHAVKESMEGIAGLEELAIETRMVEGEDAYSTILQESPGHDLIVIGASEEPLFRNFLVGTGPERVARNAEMTVMMVKRRSSPIHSFMRKAILEPTKPKALE